MLEGLDLPGLAGALGHRLRVAGLPVTPERSAHFARALALTAPLTRTRLYWTARAVFVSSSEQLRIFDYVFWLVFAHSAQEDGEEPYMPPEFKAQAGDEKPLPGARSVPKAQDSPEARSMSGPSASEDEQEDKDEDQSELEVPLALSSAEERLAEKSFSALEAHELVLLRRLMERLELATPQKVSRRTRRSRHGQHLDLRRTLRGSLRTGGDPIRLARRRRRSRPRRLVMLCDISGSMEAYSRPYLLILRSAVGGGGYAEAFVFATRLTRLTRALGGRNPEAAIQRAAAAAPDWSGGTRLGDALKRFNDRHGRRGMARGAVLVILSDGWDRGEPEMVSREMERLARLAYRIVWVNPRVTARGFSPRAGGMAAALPHCDALVSGHSMKALEEVAEAVGAESALDESWKPPKPEPGSAEPEWPSAGPSEDPVPMPSGMSPTEFNTTG